MPSYGLNDLFSDFGGSMGLWVGISILSVIELFQLFATLTVVAFIRMKESRLAQKLTGKKNSKQDSKRTGVQTVAEAVPPPPLPPGLMETTHIISHANLTGERSNLEVVDTLTDVDT